MAGPLDPVAGRCGNRRDGGVCHSGGGGRRGVAEPWRLAAVKRRTAIGGTKLLFSDLPVEESSQKETRRASCGGAAWKPFLPFTALIAQYPAAAWRWRYRVAVRPSMATAWAKTPMAEEARRWRALFTEEMVGDMAALSQKPQSGIIQPAAGGGGR